MNASGKSGDDGPELSRRPLPYSTQWIDENDLEAVEAVLRSDYLTQGPLVEKFEQALARRVGAKYAVAVSSGTAALHLACLALELPRNFRALAPAVSFVATANCAIYAGGRPEFVDVDPATGNLSLEALERRLKRGRLKPVRLILPVHLGGYPCEMSRIARLARERGIRVVEDATHALGAHHLLARGSGAAHSIGSCRYSDCAVFSFHAVKPLAAGEGGAVVTNSRRLAERIARLRTHGITRDPKRLEQCDGPWYYEMQELGYNYRLTDIQAALALSQLKRLDRMTLSRRRIARRYTRAFADHPGFDCPPRERVDRSSNHLYVIRLRLERLRSTRREIFEELRRQGLGVNVHYIPLVNQPFYRQRFKVKPAAFPGAQDYYSGAISLPLFPQMTRSDEDYVIRAVEQTVNAALDSAYC